MCFQSSCASAIDRDSDVPSTEPTALPIEYETTPVQLTVQQAFIGITVEEYASSEEDHEAVLQLTIAQALGEEFSAQNVTIEAVRPGAPMLGGLGQLLAFPDAFHFMPDASIRVTYTVRVDSALTPRELFAQLADAQESGLFDARMAENALVLGASSLLTAAADVPSFLPIGVLRESVDWIHTTLLLKSVLLFAVLALLAGYLLVVGVHPAGKRSPRSARRANAMMMSAGARKIKHGAMGMCIV